MNTVYVDGVYIGKAKNIGHGLLTDIDKEQVARRLWLWPQGLGSDEHGDPRFHTGPERACITTPPSTTPIGANVIHRSTGVHRHLAKTCRPTA